LADVQRAVIFDSAFVLGGKTEEQGRKMKKIFIILFLLSQYETPCIIGLHVLRALKPHIQPERYATYRK
jgi:hypothetical protein